MADERITPRWRDPSNDEPIDHGDARITRMRQLAEVVFADARTLEELGAAADAMDAELLHAHLHRERAIQDAEQQTAPLSTAQGFTAPCEHGRLVCGPECDAPRSGALEPEETTGGRGRGGA